MEPYYADDQIAIKYGARTEPTDDDRQRARRYWLNARYADDADPEEVIAQAIADERRRLQIAVRELHQPTTNTTAREPACPECLGGIYADDPDETRSCGCWGLSTPVCSSCSDYHNGRRYPLQWPCPTAAALSGEEAS